ncbi:MAG: hypothetical protein IJ731_06850 [Eubacterium sp.]|nr:hypothetical protein [Eubacterium sp.]
MTEIQLRHLVEDIDKANAEYILNDCDIKESFRWVNRYIAKGDTEMAVYETTVLARKIMQFGERHLTPANAKVGDGATICLWSDRHAGTIIKVTKCSITIKTTSFN